MRFLQTFARLVLVFCVSAAAPHPFVSGDRDTGGLRLVSTHAGVNVGVNSIRPVRSADGTVLARHGLRFHGARQHHPTTGVLAAASGVSSPGVAGASVSASFVARAAGSRTSARLRGPPLAI